MSRSLVGFALLTVLLPALASEALPNAAPVDQQAPTHGPGHRLTGDEMGSLYLQTPGLVSTAAEQKGMEAVADNSIYLSNEDPLQRRRQEQQHLPRTNAAPPPPPEPTATAQSILPLLPLMDGRH